MGHKRSERYHCGFKKLEFPLIFILYHLSNYCILFYNHTLYFAKYKYYKILPVYNLKEKHIS